MSKGFKKIVVGISGGVDSAVAALLLQQQGYEVHGVFMKNWSEDDFGGPCPWAEDQASATAVADHLGLSLETWNFEQEYRERVFKVMLHEYAQGRTPNPDIMCNREIKFSLFLDQALKQAPLIATGHYAVTTNGHLYKAKDESKDQSYFLAAVSSQALQKTLFPIGHLQKNNVRKIAKDAGLPNWDRPDSTGICFIGEKNMFDFLSKYLPAKPGNIVLRDGTVIGLHRGLQFYTTGQRHGFGSGLDQKKLSSAIGAGKPVFVVEKNKHNNELIVAPADQPEHIMVKEFMVAEPHWIHEITQWPWQGMAKFRYRQDNVPIILQPVGKKLRVVFQEPQRAITPGQYAVLYQGDECLGSAVIADISA